MNELRLHKQLLGKTGESIAARYLIGLGYTLVDRNFRTRYGELDIIAVHGETLVFVEVKTRINSEHGLPEEAVTPRKLKEVLKTAHYYVSTHHNLPEALRVDVIALDMDASGTLKDLRHFVNISQ